ncbi:TPA: hypothetical protein VGT23_001382 [Vibrio cholerae]|nr:hypothetical protein [Vibrio cholerae]HEQ3577816.1 hypothetical protein [Vibrio cholerae]
MIKLKPRPCAKCGNQPDVVDRRIRFVVICECKEPFNVAIGASVGFLDHIEGDEIARVAFDAVSVKDLRNSAIEAWNVRQQLITITKQRDELALALAELVETSDMNEAQLSQELLEFHEDSKSLSNAKKLLSEIGGEKDAQLK